MKLDSNLNLIINFNVWFTSITKHLVFIYRQLKKKKRYFLYYHTHKLHILLSLIKKKNLSLSTKFYHRLYSICPNLFLNIKNIFLYIVLANAICIIISVIFIFVFYFYLYVFVYEHNLFVASTHTYIHTEHNTSAASYRIYVCVCVCLTCDLCVFLYTIYSLVQKKNTTSINCLAIAPVCSLFGEKFFDG